ncbi:NADPH-dependent FMN reductase [Amycolatopsis orientalis]|uniref:NADPH-dependent FMN reductase n=1 Tax=Amycolatopsis orientalis TaxID=31958 RepID=A0A193BUI7_AMYOR|nr:NAD(P)H-dependent oxidoreductase [Amycolatopsis orientalis]ANN15838.1 NADPH-dependent FMN reductase [Amycolatopsis orientalis]
MTDKAMRLAVINSSVRDGRFGPTVAAWFVRQVESHTGVVVDYLDLADNVLPLTLSGRLSGEEEAKLSEISSRLARADAFAVVTPEYNHSFPASLKNLLDWYRTEWQAKPVGFVSYGGLAGGLRAVEQLRQVFAELHTVTVRDTVSFHMAWEQFDGQGELMNPGESVTAAKTMLDELLWWGIALREAREKSPYGF